MAFSNCITPSIRRSRNARVSALPSLWSSTHTASVAAVDAHQDRALGVVVVVGRRVAGEAPHQVGAVPADLHRTDEVLRHRLDRQRAAQRFLVPGDRRRGGTAAARGCARGSCIRRARRCRTPPASARRCSRSTRRSCPSPRRGRRAGRRPDRPRRAPRPGSAHLRSSHRIPPPRAISRREREPQFVERAVVGRALGGHVSSARRLRPNPWLARPVALRALRSISSSVRLPLPSSCGVFARASGRNCPLRSGSAPACEQHAHHRRVATVDRGDQRSFAGLVRLVDAARRP